MKTSTKGILRRSCEARAASRSLRYGEMSVTIEMIPDSAKSAETSAARRTDAERVRVLLSPQVVGFRDSYVVRDRCVETAVRAPRACVRAILYTWTLCSYPELAPTREFACAARKRRGEIRNTTRNTTGG